MMGGRHTPMIRMITLRVFWKNQVTLIEINCLVKK